MSTITAKDGTTIYYKDWGPKAAQPIVFHHGWPLSSDDWDAQMLFFVGKGYRVVAHDRRGHGRSSQVSDGHTTWTTMPPTSPPSSSTSTCATPSTSAIRPAAARQLDSSPATAKIAWPRLVLIGAVPPLMVKTPANPGGLPLEVFDGLRQQL